MLSVLLGYCGSSRAIRKVRRRSAERGATSLPVRGVCQTVALEGGEGQTRFAAS